MLNYLLSPEFQIVNTAGRPCTGYLEVFIHGSRERYYCASDFNGTLYPFQVPLDSLGSNVVLADDSNAYDVYVYNRYGSLLMSRYNVHPNGSGGGTGVSTEITSSDGSINIDKISGDYETTFNLTVARDGQDLLEYVRCDGATQLPDSYIYLPTYTEGTIAVGEKGLLLSAGNYYHVTAHVRATKSVQRDPFYDEVNIRFVIDYGTTQTDAVVEKRIVDYSLGLSQEFEVSTDVMPSSNCELLFVIDGQDVQNGSFQLLDVEAHRVYSGAPNIPSGVLSRVQAREIYQPILTAGENITIEDNVISATGGGGVEQVQSDWTESDTEAKSFIRHKPHTKPVVAGNNITIDETSTEFVISATAEPQEQANWNESDSESVQYIQNKPDLSVYATTQAMNTALAGKQDVISDLATIRSGAALGATATQPSDLAAGLATKQDVISDLATIRSGAALGTTSVQPADLAPYATTSDMNTALAGKQDTLTAGSNISIVNNVISATAAPQQQADWEEGDPSSVQYIQHKPDLSVYATDSELSAGLATKQDVISDLATIRSGAASGATAVQPADLAPYATTSDMNTALAGKQDTLTAGTNITISNNVISATVDAQVQANWAQSDPSEVDFIKNKPDLSVYATTSAMNTALAGKQDVISDLSDIRAGAALGDTAVQPSDLATVAESGNYEDLNNKPDLSVFAETSDLATVALTGSYADLNGTPTIPTATSDLTNDSDFITLADVPAQVQANWTESDSSAASYITNKPQNLVQDASYVHTDENFTSAEKTKLSGIEAGAQVNTVTDVEVDGVSVVSQGVASITLPSVPVQDVTVNGTSVVSNGTAAVTVPTATSQLTNDSGFITSVAFPVTDVQVDGTSVVNANGVADIYLSGYATTSAMNTALASKQDTLTAGTNVSITNNVISATDTTYTAGTGIDITSGAISVENPLPSSTSSDEGKVLKVDSNGDPEWATGGGGGTNADWTESDPTAPSYIENKPTPKTLTAGANISISEGVGTLTISAAAGIPASTSADEGKCLVVDSNGDPEWGTGGKTYTGTDGVVVDNVNDTVGLEAPVDLVGGPGITVDNPDGNTVRVSANTDSFFKELYYNAANTNDTAGKVYALSEPITNFMYAKITVDNMEYTNAPLVYEIDVQHNTTTCKWNSPLRNGNTDNTINLPTCQLKINASGNLVLVARGLVYNTYPSPLFTNGDNRGMRVVRVVGIFRIAGGN